MAKDQLVFEDRSGNKLTLYGAIFAGSSLIWFLSNQPLPGLAFVAVGVGLMIYASNLTITADRSTRILRLDYHYHFFHTAKEIPFDDIADIRVDRIRGNSDHRSDYRVVAVLTSGKTIPFRTFFTGGGQSEKQEAAKLHTFIFGKPRSQPSKAGLEGEQPSGDDQAAESAPESSS